MGKRIIVQRRGKGSFRYRAPSHRYKYRINYPMVNEPLKGTVIDIVNDQARSSPLAIIEFNKKTKAVIPAPLNIRVSSEINYNNHELSPGSILKLSDIPEGTVIYNIEKSPNSNGTFCRAAGSSAKVLTKTSSYVLVQLPSKKQKKFHPECRATIGTIAGSGRLEKPIMKAGKRHHMMKAKNKLYPQTSGVAMNAVDHPFGSGRGRHVGKSKIPPRNAPPGRNIGLIRARRTGRKR